MKTWFSRSKRLAIPLGIALLLFFGGIFFQTQQDFIRSFYASEFITDVPLVDGTLHILYPNRLSKTPDMESSLPIVLSVQDIPTDVEVNEYRISLVTDPHILIKNADGMVISETNLIVSGANGSKASEEFFIQALPVKKPDFAFSTLEIRIQNQDTNQPLEYLVRLSFPIETRWQAFWRYFITHFSGQAALALSIIVATVGWFNDYFKRHQNWQEKLRRFEDINTEDPLKGTLYFRRLFADGRTSTIPADILRKLVGHWEEIVNQPQTVLIEINRLFYVGEQQSAFSSMKSYSEFLGLDIVPTDVKTLEGIGKLKSCISAISNSTSTDVHPKGINDDALLDQLFWLWEEYDINVREIVVNYLILFRTRPGFDEILKAAFCGEKGNATRRRLLNDIRLKDIAPEVPVSARHWPPVRVPEFPQEGQEVQHWLENNELKANPFIASFPENDPYLYQKQCLPDQWESQYISSSAALFYTTEIRDQQAVIRMLKYVWNRSFSKDVFAVTVHLPFEELWNSQESSEYLYAIGRAIAAEWIRLLALYPQDFLDLPKASQIELAGFMAWATGSREILCARLQQVRLEMSSEDSTTDVPKNSIVIANRILNQLLSEITLLETLIQSDPPLNRLVNWLKLRPPNCEKIVFVMSAIASEGRASAFQHLRKSFNLSEQLNALGITLKGFVAAISEQPDELEREIQNLFGEVGVVRVFWTDKSLKANLVSRLAASAIAPGAVKSFDEICSSADDVFTENKIINDAHGSLARMIDLCNQQIQKT